VVVVFGCILLGLYTLTNCVGLAYKVAEGQDGSHGSFIKDLVYRDKLNSV
jgi:hypothetical protein